jgi:uncharacterized RDD family membrane protein YckC
MDANTAEIASPVRRLAGQFLDGAVIYLGFIIAVLVGEVSDALGSVALIGAVVFGVGYLWFADGLPNGQSLGKRLLHMNVIDQNSGLPCSFGQSFLRNFLLSVLGPIDWVFIFTGDRQRLGDKAAHTIVVRSDT